MLAASPYEKHKMESEKLFEKALIENKATVQGFTIALQLDKGDRLVLVSLNTETYQGEL